MKELILMAYLLAFTIAFHPVRQRRGPPKIMRITKIYSSAGASVGDRDFGDVSSYNSKFVEVIGPEKEGGELKVVLKLPGNLEDAKAALVNAPFKAKTSVEKMLGTPQVINARKRIASFLLKVKNLLMGNGFTDQANNDFSRDALAGLGLNALLAYGFVSNVSYISCLILSWISFSASTKLSPLAPEQWKPFLAIYAGYWAINNVLRPLRFSLSLVLTPAFNKLIDKVQNRTGWKRRAATASVVFGVNFCGTISYMTLGILFASAITGVPIK